MNIDHLLTEFKIKDFINDDENTPINEELTKWFLFLVAGNGKSIKDLSASNLKEFEARVLELIDLVYLWQQDRI